MESGLVSVLLPNYNGYKHLKESIDSVLNQSYEKIELIVIDDESTDNSRDLIEIYKDARIKLVYLEKGRHISYALNKGMEYAQGEFIARIDSDDVWEKEKLEKQILYLLVHPQIAACFTKINLIDEDGNNAENKYKDIYEMYNNVSNKTQKQWIKYFFSKGNCLCHSSVLMRRKMLDALDGYYKLPYVTAEDMELWMRLVLEYPIFVMDEKLVNYRWETSETKVSGNDQQSQNAFMNVKMLIKKHFLDTISNDKFIEYFSDEFINAKSCTEIELECEKAFLLLSEEKNENNFLGLQRIEKILNMPEGLEILEEKYGFDLRKYYKQYKVCDFVDSLGREKIRVHDELMNELDRRQNYINDLQSLINQYQLNTEEMKKQINDIKSLLTEQINENGKLSSSLKEQINENDKLKGVVELQNKREENSRNKIKDLQRRVNEMENSVSWKITQPIRTVGDTIRKKNM